MIFSLLSRSARRPIAAAFASRSGVGTAVAATAQFQHQFAIIQHQHQNTTQNRTFAKKIVDVRRSNQREVWSAYLSGQLSMDALFFEIDLNRSRTITVEEINYFMESVKSEGVDPKKFDLLQQLGTDHQLDKQEFSRWLGMATDVKNDGSGFAIKDEDSSSSSSSSSSDSDDEAEAAAAAPKKKIIDVRHGIQAMVWEHFLTKGTGATDLFKMIDLNKSRSISVSEITYFIESIGSKGVSYGKLTELKALGEDHELNEEEFYDWLGSATGVTLNEEGCVVEDHASSTRNDGAGCTPGQY